MISDTVKIRQSLDQDISQITQIYAQEVLTGLASFEIAPPDETIMAARRQNIVKAGFPYLVATRDDKIIGFCYAGPYRTRPAYQYTLENTVYVADSARGAGVGKALLTELIAVCEQGQWRSVIAIIGDSNNAGSIALHTALGFRKVGVIESAGYKFNRWVDSVIMQKQLNVKDSRQLPTKSSQP